MIADIDGQRLRIKIFASFVGENLIKQKQLRSVDANIYIVLIALAFGPGDYIKCIVQDAKNNSRK